jgi:hypothetical protein
MSFAATLICTSDNLMAKIYKNPLAGMMQNNAHLTAPHSIVDFSVFQRMRVAA